MTLSPADRLRLWEGALDADPVSRPLALLAAGRSDGARAWHLSIAERDAALIDVYRRVVGERIDGTFDCETCGQAVEVSLDTAALLSGPGPGSLSLALEGYLLTVRPPDSDDLAAAAALPGADARELLAGRMIVASHDGRPVPAAQLPPRVLRSALRAVEDSHPLLEPIITAECPWCGASGGVLLEIGAVLWGHVQADARRLLTEVDALARAYGWSEAEILGLSDRRRATYLELTG